MKAQSPNHWTDMEFSDSIFCFLRHLREFKVEDFSAPLCMEVYMSEMYMREVAAGVVYLLLCYHRGDTVGSLKFMGEFINPEPWR